MKPGEPYRPSNGTEGMLFEGEWCAMCGHDHAAHIGEPEKGCPIFARALAFDIGDPDYPVEWQYGTAEQVAQLVGAEVAALPVQEWWPLCTAFMPDGCS